MYIQNPSASLFGLGVPKVMGHAVLFTTRDPQLSEFETKKKH
jgi:hypothetical protein